MKLESVSLLTFLVTASAVLRSDPHEIFAKQLTAKMTMEEKFSMIAGVYGTYVGNTPAIDHLKIPAIKMQDGPQGFRPEQATGGDGTTTCWPSAMSIAATFDADLMENWAAAMAEEFAAKGANVALGPGVGVARVPTNGRNFEYLSGEDPILGAVMAKAYVAGMQDRGGVIATVKHFVNNEQETNRDSDSSNVDERTRFELYYPPFEGAIQAGVLSVMCSYNRVNNVYACQNNDTLGHLRSQLHFKGWVMSDWWATHATGDSLMAGLDQEMPVGYYFTPDLLQDAMDSGAITMRQIDTSVARILYSLHAIGLFDRPANTGDPMANVTSDAHNQLARQFAANTMTLLKNANHVLPLSVEALDGKCIAVFGDQTTVHGYGSGQVVPPYTITPAQGIQNAVAGRNIQVYYSSGASKEDVESLATKCNVAIVVVATSSSEGGDRSSLSFGSAQDNLVSSVASFNQNTIVIMNCPGAVLMPWINSVAAALVAWLPGQEAGNAMADVLFGKVNPSGRLPITMPNKDNEVGFTPDQYPGVGTPPQSAYSEQLLIGYRWYTAMGVKPLFPFGFGLSYTTFAYSNLRVKKFSMDDQSVHAHTMVSVPKGDFDWWRPVLAADFTLSNTGSVDGAEVPQLYIAYPAEVKEPPKQLRRFSKHFVARNNATDVSFVLIAKDLCYWEESFHNWELVSGTYKLMIGASVDDIRLEYSFDIVRDTK